MKSMKMISAFAGLLALAGVLGAADEPKRITMTAGKSFVIDTTADVERVAVATEDIVEAVGISQREIVLNGKAPGETTVIIWQRGEPRISYDVTVEPSTLKLAALRMKIREEVGESVQVDLDDKSVVLRGSVRTQTQGDRALALAATAGTPVNLLTIDTPAKPPQILLKVRFADVDRTASLQLGMNLFSNGATNTVGSITTGQFTPPVASGAIGGGSSNPFSLSNALNVFLYRPDLNLGATIEALQQNNLVQILAEPNVLAISGKQASFLAGGEFPYPVVQSSAGSVNNVTIQFREFGIRLTFTPTITPRGTIALEVEPEVSSLDYANGLTYAGFTIPGLDVRRVKTEIELENKQSFAIAGLLDNTVTENLSKVPGLGSIPLFGKLFQTMSKVRNNSELIVVVTPELVQPNPASGSQPPLDMPKPFLKVEPVPPANLNLDDPRTLPVSPSEPFVPSAGAGAKAVAPSAANTAAASAHPFEPGK
jgi:pilus assembly protein CpaC